MTRLTYRRQLTDARRNMRRIKEDGKQPRKSNNIRESVVYYKKISFGTRPVFKKYRVDFSSMTLLKKFVRNNSDRFYKYAYVITKTPQDYPATPPERWG